MDRIVRKFRRTERPVRKFGRSLFSPMVFTIFQYASIFVFKRIHVRCRTGFTSIIEHFIYALPYPVLALDVIKRIMIQDYTHTQKVSQTFHSILGDGSPINSFHFDKLRHDSRFNHARYRILGTPDAIDVFCQVGFFPLGTIAFIILARHSCSIQRDYSIANRFSISIGDEGAGPTHRILERGITRTEKERGFIGFFPFTRRAGVVFARFRLADFSGFRILATAYAQFCLKG